MCFSDIVVIMVIPEMVSLQQCKDKSWLGVEKVSRCEGAVNKNLIRHWGSFYCVGFFFMFSVLFAENWMWCPTWDYRNDPNITEKA